VDGRGGGRDDRPVPVPDETELYEARRGGGAEVPLTIPYRQGDVFEVAAGASEPSLRMLFMHPCTMRSGVAIADHVTVLRVRKFGKGSARDRDRWEAGNYSEIPLRKLLQNRNIYDAEMSKIDTVDSATLPRTSRIASLTDAGMLAVQHRLIFHLTRLSIDYPELEQVNRALLAELEMQRSWSELSVPAQAATETAVVEAEEAYEEFLAANDRRIRLRDPLEGEAGVRREFNEACLKQFGSLPG
jgi:hypothetical protein